MGRPEDQRESADDQSKNQGSSTSTHNTGEDTKLTPQQNKFDEMYHNLSSEGKRLLAKELNGLIEKVDRMKLKKSLISSQKQQDKLGGKPDFQFFL